MMREDGSEPGICPAARSSTWVSSRYFFKFVNSRPWNSAALRPAARPILVLDGC